jgi:cobalt/nickel transport system permease protein
MFSQAFDRYQSGDTVVHHLDPRVKVVVTFLFIVSTVALPDGAWLAFALSWGFVHIVSAVAGLPSGYVLKRSLVALVFALAAITMLFSLPGRPLFVVHIGPRHLTASDAGMVRFVSILIRSWLSVQMAILLTATTRFSDLMHALRHLRVPGLIVAVISFMFRYLFVLVDESMRLMRARDARSARPDRVGARIPGGRRPGGSLAWRARVTGNMTGQLFLRSLERSDRIYTAMLARGFRGQFITVNPHIMRRRDWEAGALGVLTLVLLQAVGHLGG